jgi:hypothetical protein
MFTPCNRSGPSRKLKRRRAFRLTRISHGKYVHQGAGMSGCQVAALMAETAALEVMLRAHLWRRRVICERRHRERHATTASSPFNIGRDRGFESPSLHCRVYCEPDLLAIGCGKSRPTKPNAHPRRLVRKVLSSRDRRKSAPA